MSYFITTGEFAWNEWPRNRLIRIFSKTDFTFSTARSANSTYMKLESGASIVETERLWLRVFSPDDLEDLARIFSKPEVMKYLGLEGKPVSKEETETALLSMIKHWERHGYGRWAVVDKESGSLIGYAGLRNHEDTAELVYLFDEPYWGKGLATEVARACLEFGFELHGLETIIAFAKPLNASSRRVLEKIGMQFVGETTVYGIFVVQYSLSHDVYRRPPDAIQV